VEVSKGHGEAADELGVGEKMGRAQQVGRSGQCGIWDGIGLGAQQHTERLAQDAVVCSDARQEKGGGGVWRRQESDAVVHIVRTREA
jgi:hypothetical protein